VNLFVSLNEGGDQYVEVVFRVIDFQINHYYEGEIIMSNNNSKTISTTTETSEGSIQIGIAITLEEKKEIFHFRYQTYIEEMSKSIKGVDYSNELLYDELDEWAILLYAKIGSQLIGTARLNMGTITDFPSEIVDFLSLDTFTNYNTEDKEQKFIFATKLMIAPTHRSSPALYLLIAKCYDLSYNNHVQFIFNACNLYLLRLYEQMGFHRYGKNFVDPGYGLLTPIVFLANDIQHLRTVRSPLFRIARKRGTVNVQAVEWFHEKFTKNSQIINSQVVREEELWSILCNRFPSPLTKAITLLHDLSDTEAKKLLHSCGILVPCATGDLITSQGDFSYSYDILVSGKLKSLTLLNPTKEYTLSGQNFGANGLTQYSKHREDIIAIAPSEILVLSGIAFQKFYHSCPDIAHKILRSIANSNKNKSFSIK